MSFEAKVCLRLDFLLGNTLFDFKLDPESDPDPLFPEADPWIRIKMKRIRNTAMNGGNVTLYNMMLTEDWVDTRTHMHLSLLLL